MTKYAYKTCSSKCKYLNYKVTVLGQVNRPGTYTINDGNATLLSALGFGGRPHQLWH